MLLYMWVSRDIIVPENTFVRGNIYIHIYIKIFAAHV